MGRIKNPIYLESGKKQVVDNGNLVKPTFSLYRITERVIIEDDCQMVVDSMEITLTGSFELIGSLRMIA